MDIERVMRGTPTSVTVVFRGDEEPLDADGAVTVEIRRADGTTLLSTTAVPGDPGSGQYTVVIPAQTDLNILEVVWTGEFSGNEASLVSYVEIVGSFLFTVSELRHFDQTLKNADRFPTEALEEKRTLVEEEFEDICSRSFIPRFHREEFTKLSGEAYLSLRKAEPIDITKLTVDGEDRLDWVTGGLIRTDRDDPKVLNLFGPAQAITRTRAAVVIEYEYGMRKVPPLIKDAGMKRARGLLLGQNATIDERATVMAIPEFGTFNLATPGQKGSYTGIPAIDAILDRYMLGIGGAGAY